MNRFAMLASILFFVFPLFGAWQPPVNCGPNVNSASDDHSCFVTDDSNTLYFSSYGWGGYGLWDLFRSTWNGSSWGPNSNLGQPPNSPQSELHPFYHSWDNRLYFSSHSASISWHVWFSAVQGGLWGARTMCNIDPLPPASLQFMGAIGPDGKLYFCVQDTPGSGYTLKIYKADPSGDNWVNATLLNSYINDGNYNMDLFITPDGQHLYFSSNRPGGYGNYDVWVSNWTGSDWSPAINVGSAINSSSNETRPVLSHDCNKLYFASDKPGGYGGIDLYYSVDPDVKVQPTSIGQVKAMFQ